MAIQDKLSAVCGNVSQTLASLIKIALLSRRPTVKKTAGGEEIVILGNGPSLNQTVAESMPFLASRKKLAVNFAANTPLFLDLKPDYYVLADPHFFQASDNENVKKLWDTFLTKVDWAMTLFVPTRIKSPHLDRLKTNSHITVNRYNTTPVEGFKAFRNAVYRTGLGMPRPRNVLIPSIMLALNAGFRTVYVAGADHSWMKTLSVNDRNQVVSIQPHFYKDNEKETARVNTEYMNYPLHQIIYSFYVAFKSYYVIRDYAASIGATVWNITPESFIDAFPRKKV